MPSTYNSTSRKASNASALVEMRVLTPLIRNTFPVAGEISSNVSGSLGS